MCTKCSFSRTLLGVHIPNACFPFLRHQRSIPAAATYSLWRIQKLWQLSIMHEASFHTTECTVAFIFLLFSSFSRSNLLTSEQSSLTLQYLSPVFCFIWNWDELWKTASKCCFLWLYNKRIENILSKVRYNTQSIAVSQCIWAQHGEDVLCSFKVKLPIDHHKPIAMVV